MFLPFRDIPSDVFKPKKVNYNFLKAIKHTTFDGFLLDGKIAANLDVAVFNTNRRLMNSHLGLEQANAYV